MVAITLLAVGCNDSSSTTTEPTTTTTVPPTTTTAPVVEWPPEQTAEHGGMSWAVYLATSDEPDYATASAAAIERLTDVAYEFFSYGAELACDQDAATALGKDPGTIAIAIYFSNEPDALGFAELYRDQTGDEPIGVVEVTTFCLD